MQRPDVPAGMWSRIFSDPRSSVLFVPLVVTLKREIRHPLVVEPFAAVPVAYMK